MTAPIIHSNAVDALAMPRVVWLGQNLIGLVFQLMKLLPARFSIEKAVENGELAAGGRIVETTSGTFGLALAMVAKLRGYPLTLVSDPAIDPPLYRRLLDLGANVHILQEGSPSGGFQQARMELLEHILASNAGSFCPRQYSSPHNPGSYAPCAELITHAVGAIDCLVGTVGSGGSVCGIASYLRVVLPELTVIGVDTHGSVIFGQSDAGASRLLRGLGNSIRPSNVDHSTFDWIHWVSAAEAFFATRDLHRNHALFMGPTSGAAYMVAKWWAEVNPDALTAVLLPDEGFRYQDTVYNDRWLVEKGAHVTELPHEPVVWDRPHDGEPVWASYRWNRVEYAQVVTSPTICEPSLL